MLAIWFVVVVDDDANIPAVCQHSSFGVFHQVTSLAKPSMYVVSQDDMNKLSSNILVNGLRMPPIPSKSAR